MNKETATQIVDDWFNNRRMDAIKNLRYDTSMDLISAKRYLEMEGYGSGPVELEHKLCEDFVINPQERLRELRKQRDEIDAQIELVEAEIAENSRRDIHQGMEDLKKITVDEVCDELYGPAEVKK